MKIAIIGAGNMGGAIARGLSRGSVVPTKNIFVSNPSWGKLENLKKEYPEINVLTNNSEAARNADLIIFAVKPWLLKEVADKVKHDVGFNNKIVASVAGGIGISDLKEIVVDDHGFIPPIYYIIPNTAMSVGESMTFITASGSDAQTDSLILEMFCEQGDAMIVPERMMNGGMAVASCGIAYAMRYIRAAMLGGVELGLYPSDARRAVMQTLKGAVKLLEINGTHPEEEIDRVTTPGGITIRGLNAMEESGFSAGVIAGLRSSRPQKS